MGKSKPPKRSLPYKRIEKTRLEDSMTLEEKNLWEEQKKLFYPKPKK